MQALLFNLELVAHFFFQSGDDNEELNQGLNVNIDQNYGNGDLDMEAGFEGKCKIISILIIIMIMIIVITLLLLFFSHPISKLFAYKAKFIPFT